MPFKITFSEEAFRQLKKFDNLIVKRILSKIDSAAENPTHFFQRLAEREEFKLRACDYRIIAKILFNEKTIHVLSLGHRKNIYEKLRRK